MAEKVTKIEFPERPYPCLRPSQIPALTAHGLSDIDYQWDF